MPDYPATSPNELAQTLQAYLLRNTDARPLYRKLADGLSEVVLQGGGDLHSHLPSERVLSEELGIARATLRRALQELTSAGLLVRRQGAKTEIAPRLEKKLSALTGFSEEMRARGMLPSQHWVKREIVAATNDEVMAMALSAGEQVLHLDRVRLADGIPIAFERARVPVSILPRPDLVRDSLYEALRLSGHAPVRGLQRIRAGVMDKAEAELMQRRAGHPILVIERRCFLADGRAVEFTQTHYDGERYDFITELLS